MQLAGLVMMGFEVLPRRPPGQAPIRFHNGFHVRAPFFPKAPERRISDSMLRCGDVMNIVPESDYGPRNVVFVSNSAQTCHADEEGHAMLRLESDPAGSQHPNEVRTG